MQRFDAAVIGAGVLGCFAARELSRYKIDTVLFEAREDVCTGVTRANTAVVYPGYDHKPGTLKAEMTVRANASFNRLCEELDVPFSRCGSLMLSYGQKADEVLRKKLRQGLVNGVPGLRLLSPEETYAMEPGLAPGLSTALYSPSAGTVNPWQLGIAACENAVQNGVQLRLNTRVIAMHADAGGFVLETDRGTFAVKAVLNCAGLASDVVQELLFPSAVHIVPTAGDYLVLDRACAQMPARIIEYEPEDGTKGLTAVPTVEGSLLLGTTERINTVCYATEESGISEVKAMAVRLFPGLDCNDVIRSFAAVRPNPISRDGKDINSFCIEHPAKLFWSLIGIKTPGLTCARELGFYLAGRLAEEMAAEADPQFDPVRHGIRSVRGLSFVERESLVRQNSDYGEIICFCEDITRAEVLEAIRRGAVTVDGVKRRIGTGMGRCQGARCGQKIAAMLSEQLGISESTVMKDGPGSVIVRAGHEKL